MKILQLSFDWASQRHAFAWNDVESGEQGEGYVSASSESFHKWFEALRERFADRQIEVIVEMTKGPLVSMLLDYPKVSIYPLSPICSANYRKGFHPSGAKSDPADALLWLDYLQRHKDKLRLLKASSEQAELIDRFTRARRDFVDEITRVLLSTLNLLKQYYPQALDLAGDLRSPMSWAFLRRWPELECLKRARSQTLRNFYHQHGLRGEQRVQERIDQVRNSRPLCKSRTCIEPCMLSLAANLNRLEVLTKAVDEHDKAIERALEDCEAPRREVVESAPGAGKVMAPRLYAALDYLSNAGEAQADIAAAVAGVAPVCTSSGKSHRVKRRSGKPKFLHQTLIEHANFSRMKSAWAAEYYRQGKAAGKAHWEILRGLACKWLRILLKCWEDSTAYDEERYLETLRRRRSPYAPPLS